MNSDKGQLICGENIMEKMILLYSYPNEITRQIADICLRLNVTCKKVPKKRFSQTIGNHIGALGHGAMRDIYEGDELSEPVMLFAGMSSKELDAALDALKTAGIPATSLKAIVTMYNINWTILDLYAELVKEREEMGRAH